MPPPSSPRSRRQTPPPPPPNLNDPLSYLSSPVPDLASTLHTHADNEADEANVTFLRNSLDDLTQTAQQHEDESTSQTHVDSERDPRRAGSAAYHAPIATSESVNDLSRRERLQRVLARFSRIQDPTAVSSSSAAYSNRTPSPNRQRLYDWAPLHDDTSQPEDNELEGIVAELRRQQPETHPDILRVLGQRQLETWRQAARESAALPSASESTDAADRRERLRERRRRESEWMSLRSRAVIQRARQESSPSATERMLRYVIERERSGMSEEEERARNAGWFNPGSSANGEQRHRNGAPGRDPWPLSTSASELRARTLQERADIMQRRYHAENAAARLPRISTPPVPIVPSTSTSTSQFLENALKYLDKLQSCYEHEEALSAAIEHGLRTKESFDDKHDDFITDIAELDALPASSWLQACTIFEGHQHAMNSNNSLRQSRSGSASAHAVEQINPNFRGSVAAATAFDHPPGSTQVQPFDSTRPWLSHQLTPPFQPTLKPFDGHWPVRVILHSIDPERMTLQGTMEAYDVPQPATAMSPLSSTERPKAGQKHAPITTYLEGHIIDLATHSFLTPSASVEKRNCPHPTSAENATPYTTRTDGVSFPAANAHTDAANWRKLPPFSQMPSDEEAARCLLSKGRMNQLHEDYIFMRWKERCFVHSKEDKCHESDRRSDQDRGHGLTISGFYYISLSRRDGVVEGLYFDPMSTPYQHLRLRGVANGWPAFEFR